MSVSMLSSLSGASVLSNSARLVSTFSTKSSSKAATEVDDANRQVQNDQQRVDQRKTEADRKASEAQQAADELKSARAAVARDQAALNQAKSREKLDVYT